MDNQERGTCFRVLIIAFFTLLSTSVFGSHAMGVDVSYVWISGNTYEFTVNFYRDCAGITAPAAVTLNVNSPSSCGPAATISLTQQGPGVEVSPLCPAQLGNSSCSGGAQPGVEKYVYKGQYTFPVSCTDWTISWNHCCRNAAITNLNLPSSQNMYVQTKLDNTPGLQNSSPSFTSLPVPYICSNQQFCYNHGAVDVDGDSIVYSLVNALTTNGSPIAYVAPYTPTYPITTVSGTVSFDSSTGSMCVTPNATQVCVVTILVEEYRNGVVIGSTMRDLQIVVQNCSNLQPNLSSGGIINQFGGANIDSNSVEMCPGDSLYFDLSFTDPNSGDNITVTTNLAASIPGANFTTFGTNPVIGSFSWVPTVADIGLKSFVVTIQDDGCPILGSQVYSFDINVLQGTDAGPDRAYCPGGGPLQLNAVGGSTFTWSVISGDGSSLSCTSCSNPLSSPSVPSTYEVLSNLSGICKNRDTVFVDVVSDFTLDAGLPDTICKYGAANLNASATPGGQGPFSYSWTSGPTLSNPAAEDPIAQPLNTTKYFLTGVSAAGCTITDSVMVVVSGVAPQVQAGPGDSICPGQSTQLSTLVFPDVCDTTSLSCSGPVTYGAIPMGTSSSYVYSPYYLSTITGYQNRRQYLFTPTELVNMGFSAGMISAIGMDVITPGDAVTDLTIKMGCVTPLEFSNTTFMTGLTTVKNSFTTAIPTVGYNMINLDYPYLWDGKSSLVIEICKGTAQIGNPTYVQYGCGTGYKTLYYTSTLASTCTQPTGTRTTCRPDFRFEFCDAVPSGLTYSWVPSSTVSNPAIPTPTASPTNTTAYQVLVSDGNCVGSDYVIVAIDSTVYVGVSVDDPMPCLGDTISLSSSVVGSPSATPLPCGTNATSCVNPNHIELIGTGAASSATTGPFYATSANQRFGNKVQYIFTAGELIASGVSITGTISQLSWDVTTSLGEKWRDIEIKMGCTSQSEYLTTGFVSGLTTVYSGGGTYTSTNGWNTFNITPYDWDGSSNLVVEICSETFNGNSNPELVSYTSTAPTYRTVYRHDACNCSACSQTTGTRSFNRPNMLFTICDAAGGGFTYTWSPTTNMTNPSIPNPDVEGITGPETYLLTVSGGVCSVQDSVSIVICGTLPLDMLELSGNLNGGGVDLQWEVSEERDVHHYELRHSLDGRSWSQLTKTEATGTQKYNWLHAQPARGMNFYQVIQEKSNGERYASNTVELSFISGGGIHIYPNPVKSEALLFLELNNPGEPLLELEIIDLLGRQFLQKSYDLQEGHNRVEFSADLPPGTWIFKTRVGHRVKTHKILIIE